MAIIKMKNVREMNEKDLKDRLTELKLEISKDRASSEIGTVKNPGRIQELRRTVARILTEQNSRKAKARMTPKASSGPKNDTKKKKPNEVVK